jgi:hypothetical protein
MSSNFPTHPKKNKKKDTIFKKIASLSFILYSLINNFLVLKIYWMFYNIILGFSKLLWVVSHGENEWVAQLSWIKV